jgi:hypothetical protein
VAKTPKPPVPASTKPAATLAQDERAALLRKRIQELADGAVPSGAAPTPREFTDEAARKAWEAQQRKKRSRKGK